MHKRWRSICRRRMRNQPAVRKTVESALSEALTAGSSV
jgi:hypothetical protein